jgi:recombination-promoting nuclease RpnB
MPEISKPHDLLFKRTLQNKKIMQDWLHAHLPEEIIALTDMSTLTPVPTEFIPQWPETLYSDVVYSCCINEQPGYFYIAAEHQSTADPLMAFRVLKYTVELMSHHLNQGYKKLPVILPLVLYHGEKSPYPHSVEIWDCYDNPETASQWALRPFRLIDLTVLSDEEINRHGLSSAMEILFRHSRQKEFPLDWLGQLLTDGKMTTIYTEIGSGYFKDVLRYFIEICGRSASAEGTKELEQALALWVSAVPQAQEDIMTFAQQLEQKGRQEGIQQGIQQGIEQGEKQASLKMARQFLANGVARNVVKMSTGLSDEELDNLPD